MRFFFIRHGQSANNMLYAATGSNKRRDSDPELTDIGRQQVDFLAEYLSYEMPGITHLYTSLMVRSVATGTVVAKRLSLPLVAWPDLHEEGGIYLSDEHGIHIGQPGKNRAYFVEYYPELVLPDMLGVSGWWNRAFETDDERPVRARSVLRELINRHGNSNHRVAVISHGGFYNQFLSALLNPLHKQPVWFVLNNTAITCLDFFPTRIEFLYHNRVDFLPPDLVT
jgi:2,3-bisphosphoglycerate-dependent phosphoglycerate mutase